jgi:anti-sigma B factor antagonist
MKQNNTIRIENKLGYIWVVMPDAISRDDYRAIETEIQGHLTAETNRLVLDLAETNYVFSSGLGLLIRLNKMAIQKNGAMYLVNVSVDLREVFSMVNLDKYFSIYETDIEFQVFQEDVWKKTRPREPVKFLCFHQVENGVCRVHLSGKLTADNDTSELNESIYTESVRYYVFDLAGLDIIDSAGADLLFRVVGTIRSSGGECIAFGAGDIVGELLRVMQGGPELAVFESEEDALKNIGKWGTH